MLPLAAVLHTHVQYLHYFKDDNNLRPRDVTHAIVAKLNTEWLHMDKPVVQLEWMLMPLFCSLTGYTVKAVQRKIEEGKWIEGRHYKRSPDGHITLNLQAYYRWVSERDA